MLARIKSIFRPETKSLATSDAWLMELFGATTTTSGVSVTPRTAMTCAPVRAAVQAIAETVGQLPFPVYARHTDGSKERATDHPVYPLLNSISNPWTPASLLREAITRDALLHRDGGFAFINRVGGKPVELLRLDPETVQVTYDLVTGEPIYRLSNSAGSRIVPPENIIHIPSPSLTGCGLVQDGREAIGLALTLERHAAQLFGRGARPSGVLKFDTKLDAETAARIKQSWQAAHAGNNSGNTAVLESGGNFQPLSFNSVDSQFLEMRALAVAEIARIFRVSPIFLQDYARATWGNSAEMGRQFLVYTIMPWLIRWEGEVLLKLFTEQERERFYAEFLTDALTRGDLATRMAAYSTAIAARILSPNEARQAENRPAYKGGDEFANPNTTPGKAPSNNGAAQ